MAPAVNALRAQIMDVFSAHLMLSFSALCPRVPPRTGDRIGQTPPIDPLLINLGDPTETRTFEKGRSEVYGVVHRARRGAR